MTPDQGPSRLSAERVGVIKDIAARYGTPTHIIFHQDLQSAYAGFASFPAAERGGLIVRYAMKANPLTGVLQAFDTMGAHIDASTRYEVDHAENKAGISGDKIRLTSQQQQTHEYHLRLANSGVLYTACSISQLKRYGEALPGTSVGVRFNPGIGSGGYANTDTGGEYAAFGIYQQLDEIQAALDTHNLRVDTVHVHIGSGSNPDKQLEAMEFALARVRDFRAERVDMGGGYKVARMPDDTGTDIVQMGRQMSDRLAAFADSPGGWPVLLEIEPGTGLIALAGETVYTVTEKRPIGDGLLVVDGGMHINARNALYGAPHPMKGISVIGDDLSRSEGNIVVVGEECESGSVLTVDPGKPGQKKPWPLQDLEVGDRIVQGATGAYGYGMANAHYNSYPDPAIVMVYKEGLHEVLLPREEPSHVHEREIVLTRFDPQGWIERPSHHRLSRLFVAPDGNTTVLIRLMEPIDRYTPGAIAREVWTRPTEQRPLEAYTDRELAAEIASRGLPPLRELETVRRSVAASRI